MQRLYYDCRERTRRLIAALDDGDLPALETGLRDAKEVLSVYRAQAAQWSDPGLAREMEALGAAIEGLDRNLRGIRELARQQVGVILQARPVLAELVSRPCGYGLPVC